VTTFWKKLKSPFALVAQGFLVGGALFWTTQPVQSWLTF
jgi:hypothetical protein